MSASYYENANNFNRALEMKQLKSSRNILQNAVHRIKKMLSNLKRRKVVKPVETVVVCEPSLEEIENALNEALEAKARLSAKPVLTMPKQTFLILAPDSDICLKYQSPSVYCQHQAPERQSPFLY